MWKKRGGKNVVWINVLVGVVEMGNQKQKWTAEEEEALVAGVDKHGTGKWKNILKDPEFTPLLIHRSNIDLKDKWRNMNMSFTASVQGSKDKIRVLKEKAITAVPILAIPNALLALPPPENEHSSPMVDASNFPNGKSTPRYNAMIYEALTSIEDRNGSDLIAISSFIQQKYEVPPNVRRLLTSKLRRLVSQGKLEKVQNRYKITDAISSAKILTLLQRENRCREPLPGGFKTPAAAAVILNEETEEEAARTTAYLIADADNKSFLAAEAVKEAEAYEKRAEDMHSLYMLTKELHEQFE